MAAASAGGRQGHQGRSQCQRRQRRHRRRSARSPSLNIGRLFIQLKPRDERTLSADQVIQELRPKVGAASPASTTYFQSLQNINLGGRLAKSAYQYTLQDGDTDELYHYAQIMQDRIAQLAGRAGRELRPPAPQPARHRQYRPRQGGAARHHRRPDPQHLLQRLRRAPDLDHLRALEQLLRHPRARQALSSSRPTICRRSICSSATGQAVPLEAVATLSTGRRPGDGEPSGPASLGHDLLQPGARILARHRRRRDRRSSSARSTCRSPSPPATRATPRSSRQALQGPGAAAHGRGARHLHRARHSLRELHPSDHDPVGPAGGGAGRARDAAAVPSGSERHRHHRHRHADRHRQEERDHDDRLRARAAARRQRDAGGGDLRGLHAALPPDHDDDHGGDHGRPADRGRLRRRLRAAPAAGPRRGRRPRRVAVADAVHHAGDLSLSRDARGASFAPALLRSQAAAPRRSMPSAHAASSRGE